VSPARRRACVEHVVRELGVSERKACAVLGQHRSTQRKQPRGCDDEAALTADIIDLAKRYGRYGYRRITALLRDAGWSVMFDVEVDGQPYQELHVDGGAVAQAFLYPTAVGEQRRAALRARRPLPPVRAWMIRNARLDASWAATNRRTLSIAQRSIATMTAASGYNDAVRIWLNAERDGIEFRMAYIGSDFTTVYDKPFDQAYMTPLFNYGFERARGGYPWSRQPPFTA